ncbi:hypothetical protein SADUNF_Sadunf16G0218700 [Salix dunnii]|uniref:Uncharacterized protein n=1 Tax=Salix dunnii TaxID=1413687 RepID=A0A835JCJ1_9ROSI|nr:hypothetical protein SADUNF_Sadunf16G0218700 [Salix dunnii]
MIAQIAEAMGWHGSFLKSICDPSHSYHFTSNTTALSLDWKTNRLTGDLKFAKKITCHLNSREGSCDEYEERQRLHAVNSRNWYSFKRVHLRKRVRLKIPSPRRFLMRKVKLVSAVRLPCAKVLKKEGQARFGDLFAGNYLFMQVNPTPLK